jgi:hypothetical protein
VAAVALPVGAQGTATPVSHGPGGAQADSLLFYGFAPAYTPFQQASLCVQPSLVLRTPLQVSGGNPPPADRSGSFSFDFNAWGVPGATPMRARRSGST